MPKAKSKRTKFPKRITGKAARKTVPQKIAGKKVSLAGKFSNQQALEDLITAEGGTVTKSLAADVHFLVVGATRGSGPSGPEKEARKLNQRGASIQIRDETSFHAILAPTRDELLTLLKSLPGLTRVGAHLNGSSRSLPSLAGADLQGWTIKAEHRIGKLRGLNFDSADMRNSRLTHLEFDPLHNVNLDGAALSHCWFEGLIGCSVRDADLINPYLQNDVAGSDFSGSTLVEASPYYVNGNAAIFRNCKFQKCELKNCKFPKADFSNAHLAGSNLEEVDLTGATLIGADLQKADLSRAKLVRAKLTKADLRGATLRQADMTGAVVDGARFDGADVIGLKISGKQIAKASGVAAEQVAGRGRVGPNLKNLAKVAARSRWFMTEAKLHLSTGEVPVSAGLSHGTASGSYGPAHNFYKPTLPAVMVDLSNHYFEGTLDLDSIRTKIDGKLAKKGDLADLAKAAWCEAFGIGDPEGNSWKTDKRTRRGEQDAFRDQILADLRRGPKGVKRWNDWTFSEQRAGKRMSFRNADLAGAKIAGVRFGLYDDLRGANLNGADMSGADLMFCDLRGASLQSTNLHKAQMPSGKFTDADMSGASITSARAHGSTFRRVNFQKADLSGGDFTGCDIIGADLSSAKLDSVDFSKARYDESTRWPAGAEMPKGMRWCGKGDDPAMAQALSTLAQAGPIDLRTFLERLQQQVDAARYDKALAMLKADSFKLFAQVEPDSVIGVVKSQTDPELVYSCRLAADGKFACCTQNLNICGGLRGSLCKHLLVLIIGLANAGELDPTKVDLWVAASRLRKPEVEKETMSEAFLRYKGAEAGEVDWRPTETIPEDFYAM